MKEWIVVYKESTVVDALVMECERWEPDNPNSWLPLCPVCGAQPVDVAVDADLNSDPYVVRSVSFTGCWHRIVPIWTM
ncbi:hypothetical protein [Streptomyces sp. CBMA152]|uniref:hypothetical protein n=1 Tax=Streptomyces sp. CBMA152 TaxID=1896312 RepID=UPI0016615C7B|nr:hypothetical protein [Streptomyces sp. CBMA152]MBD0743575.1 hypothetical protein [Streptomyces sp. CBMA152]